MTVTVIKSTDVGAPAMTGAAGGAIAALDFALVTGLGWTKPFTGTNKAVYRPATGTRMFLRFTQDGSLSLPTNTPGFNGYETMTDIDTGTNRFPGLAQTTNHLKVSADTSATARPWVIIGDSSTAYIFINEATTISRGGLFRGHMFGDYTSFKPTTDDWKCLNIGNDTISTLTSAANGVVANHYQPRGFTGLGSSVNLGKHSDSAKMQSSTFIGANGAPFPNGPDGGIYMAPIYIHDTNTNFYGKLRGFWCPLHVTTTWPFGSFDTFEGTGALAGKTFLFLVNHSNNGGHCIETSNTWTA